MSSRREGRAHSGPPPAGPARRPTSSKRRAAAPRLPPLRAPEPTPARSAGRAPRARARLPRPSRAHRGPPCPRWWPQVGEHLPSGAGQAPLQKRPAGLGHTVRSSRGSDCDLDLPAAPPRAPGAPKAESSQAAPSAARACGGADSRRPRTPPRSPGFAHPICPGPAGWEEAWQVGGGGWKKGGGIRVFSGLQAHDPQPLPF